MTDGRDDPGIRKGSILLSSLVLTPDNGLESYLAKRVRRSKVTAEQLKRARAVLDAVAFAIRGTGDANWRRLDEAWEILRHNTPPRDEDDAKPEAKTDARTQTAPEAAQRPSSPRPQPAPAAQSRPGEPPQITPPSPRPAAAAPQPPARMPVAKSSDAGVDHTVFASGSSVDATLPFQGDSPLPRSALEDLQPLPPSDLDGTSALGVHLDLGDALPFDNAAERPPELTLEHYASRAAELDARPHDRTAIDLKYGIKNVRAAVALDSQWQERFRADRAAADRYRELVAHYRQWFTQRR